MFRQINSLADNLLSRIDNPSARSDLFPYGYYEEGLYDIDDEKFGFIFECDPIVGTSDNLYKQLSLLFDDQLPKGGVLEILLLASDDLSDCFEKWERSRTKQSPIYKKLAEHRKNYKANQSSPLVQRNYRLFFSYSQLGSRKDVLVFKEVFYRILGSLGFVPSEPSEDEFLSLVRELVHYPNTANEKNEYSGLETLSYALNDVSNALRVTKNGVYCEDNYLTKVYEVAGYPEGFSIDALPNLLGDDHSENLQISSRFAIIYTISNEIPDLQQEGLKKKGEYVLKQANNFLGKVNRVIEEEGREWNHIIQNNLKRKERFLRSSFMVMLSATEALMPKVEQNLISLWRKNDFVLKPLHYFHLPALLSFCPFMNNTTLGDLLNKFSLRKTSLSSEPGALMPINAEWKGSKNGGMLLTGRKGQLFSWNNFEGGSNYNAIVVGESGSGKSVFLQELVLSHLASGAKVFVVDIGRSFEKTCKLLGGDFINFGIKSDVCLNPFSNLFNDHEKNNENIIKDSLNYLKIVISKMVAPKERTTDIQDSLISAAITELLEKYGSDASIDRLIELLNQSNVERAKDLALMLFEFSTRGAYGRFFHGKSNLSFKNDLTVLEFEELREQPGLGGVIMQMLAIQIIQQVYLGDRKQKFVLLFDEAWYALENFAALLSSIARTIRKYNGSLILGTQSLKNFYAGDHSDRMGVIENSAWRVFLRQSGESSASLEKMRMPDHLIRQVNNLTTVSGKYSEALIYQSNAHYFISRLMLDKFAQVLYSSSPQVFSKVQHFVERGLKIEDAIEEVMKTL